MQGIKDKYDEALSGEIVLSEKLTNIMGNNKTDIGKARIKAEKDMV